MFLYPNKFFMHILLTLISLYCREETNFCQPLDKDNCVNKALYSKVKGLLSHELENTTQLSRVNRILSRNNDIKEKGETIVDSTHTIKKNKIKVNERKPAHENSKENKLTVEHYDLTKKRKRTLFKKMKLKEKKKNYTGLDPAFVKKVKKMKYASKNKDDNNSYGNKIKKFCKKLSFPHVILMLIILVASAVRACEECGFFSSG
ncbi:unnamed protein product [Plasmodium vivax]|uniref:(malaria parasite P. vivax) hypothetical protein n=1 Tax=Plasmodium vivax TaxID=5855 RepID=A0A8S4HFT2_PLAVI|nr:unnamed protein product [Plasmodium vivax]